jgi:hypothetical protein
LNFLFGNMTLKQKMGVVLRQRGEFRCPRKLEHVQEHESTAAVPTVDSGLLAAAITHLDRRRASRPRTLQSLRQSLSDRFTKQLGDVSAAALVDHLCLIGVVVPNKDGTISYRSMQHSA